MSHILDLLVNSVQKPMKTLSNQCLFYKNFEKEFLYSCHLVLYTHTNPFCRITVHHQLLGPQHVLKRPHKFNRMTWPMRNVFPVCLNDRIVCLVYRWNLSLLLTNRTHFLSHDLISHTSWNCQKNLLPLQTSALFGSAKLNTSVPTTFAAGKTSLQKRCFGDTLDYLSNCTDIPSTLSIYTFTKRNLSWSESNHVVASFLLEIIDGGFSNHQITSSDINKF